MLSAPVQELYSVTDLARALGMSEPQIRRLIKNGTITAKKIGQLWRISRQEVDRLVSEKEG